jgi:hypothetical protein
MAAPSRACSPFLVATRGALVLALAAATGCQWTRNYYDSLKGEGFPEWSESMGGTRGANPNAKPSGFFTDRRSEQIEQSLGGGF